MSLCRPWDASWTRARLCNSVRQRWVTEARRVASTAQIGSSRCWPWRPRAPRPSSARPRCSQGCRPASAADVAREVRRLRRHGRFPSARNPSATSFCSTGSMTTSRRASSFVILCMTPLTNKGCSYEHPCLYHRGLLLCHYAISELHSAVTVHKIRIERADTMTAVSLCLI